MNDEDAISDPETSEPTTYRALWWGLWSNVYLVNLPVPLFFGFLVTSGGGWIGMGCGVIVTWCLGQIVCLWSGTLRKALVIGGCVVALTQLFPVLQFILVGIAVDLWEGATGISFDGGPQPRTALEFSGFAVTLLTAQMHIAIAVAVGYLALGVRELCTKRKEQ